jgi:hypothetical protein
VTSGEHGASSREAEFLPAPRSLLLACSSS